MSFQLHIIGTNFKKTELENVGRVQWPTPEAAMAFLDQARQSLSLDEIFHIKTCNRREFVIYAPNSPLSSAELKTALVQEASRSIGQPLDPHHFYHHSDEAAVRHICRVASSMDSMVLGETEIIKQIKDQAEAAGQQGLLGKRLRTLVDTSLWASKQVRTQTKITQNVVSMASLAFRETVQRLTGSPTRRVVFVGAGHFVTSVLPTFVKAKDLELTFVSRRPPIELAAEYGGKTMTLSEFLKNPVPFDVMFTATAAPHTIFEKNWIEAHAQGALILDAALPRDVDSEVRSMATIRYLDLEQMEAILAENRSQRRAEIPKAQPIFDEAVAKLEARWLEFDLAAYNQQISMHYKETGERALAHLLKDLAPHLQPGSEEALREWTQSLVGKLTTIPILGLKGVAKELGVPAVDAYTRGISGASNLFKN